MTTKILDILQSGADVTINVKSSDLREFGRYLMTLPRKRQKGA